MMSIRIRAASGLTLLEMLVVIAILAAVAAGTTALVADADQQVRFDDTRARLRTLRLAVLGVPPTADDSGVAGFVADMGRLPSSLRELLEPTDAADQELAAWAYDDDYAIGGGWRGPYLTGYVLDPDGARTYRDGWLNPDTGAADLNFGWIVTTAADTFAVRSRGADGLTDGTPPPTDVYAKDYPDASEPLVAALDYLVDLSGWTVRVDFGGDVPSSGVRAAVFYPDNGDPSAPEYETSAAGTSVGDGVYAFVFDDEARVPAGRRSVAVIELGDLAGSGVGDAGRHPYSTVLRARSTPAPLSFSWTLSP